MWMNATQEEKKNIIQRYVDMSSQYYSRQKNFLTEFLENYQIIDKDRTQVAVQCYNGDDLRTYKTTQHFQNVHTMDLTNTIENIPNLYKGGAYNPVEALLGVGISVLKDEGIFHEGSGSREDVKNVILITMSNTNFMMA